MPFFAMLPYAADDAVWRCAEMPADADDADAFAMLILLRCYLQVKVPRRPRCHCFGDAVAASAATPCRDFSAAAAATAAPPMPIPRRLPLLPPPLFATIFSLRFRHFLPPLRRGGNNAFVTPPLLYYIRFAADATRAAMPLRYVCAYVRCR